MGLSYKKLWILLIQNELKKTDLKEKCKISPATLARLGKDETVSMDVLQRICEALNCNIGDIVDYIPDKDN